MALTMKFAAPVGCRNEFFSTVRLGKEWQTRIAQEASKGEKVTISMVDLDGVSLGTAEVVDSWFGPLTHVPAMMLEIQHNPICRTWSGLLTMLQTHYEKALTPHDEVVVIRLEFKGSIIKLATAGDLPPSDTFGGN